ADGTHPTERVAATGGPPAGPLGPVGQEARMSITGELTADGRDLVLTRSLAVTPAQVWQHLMDTGLLETWYGSYAGVPSSGVVQLTMTAEPGVASASPFTIHACEPERLLSVCSAMGGGDLDALPRDH